jgi:fumarate hydratase class I
MHELIVRTCTELPKDISQALHEAYLSEDEGSIAHETLRIILESSFLSSNAKLPICQDTGAILCFIQADQNVNILLIEESIRDAVQALTKKGILRQNCVDPLTDTNTGNNIGAHVPQIHFEPVHGPVRVSVMLKGGGSENMSTQYSLPLARIKAERDLEGVRRCILDAVHQAQGQGCAPGVLGICIGGDRASGYLMAKRQLFRPLCDVNPSPILASLEQTVLADANTLSVGPMGLGGKTTILGIKIGTAGRHPACYYVTVSYSCWATRRYTIELTDNGEILRWL